MKHETPRPYYLNCWWPLAYWEALIRKFDHADRLAEPDLEGEGALLVWENEGGLLAAIH